MTSLTRWDLSGCPRGHGYMGGGISIFSHYQVYPDYLEAMEQAYGRERTGEILSFNRHNGLIYPSCTIRDNIQSVRVVIPVSVNETHHRVLDFQVERRAAEHAGAHPALFPPDQLPGVDGRPG